MLGLYVFEITLLCSPRMLQKNTVKTVILRNIFTILIFYFKGAVCDFLRHEIVNCNVETSIFCDMYCEKSYTNIYALN